MNVIPFLIVCLFYFYGFILLYITHLSKKKGYRDAFINNLANSFVFLASLTINVFIINLIFLSNRDFIVFPFDIFMAWFIIGFLPFFYLLIVREKQKARKGKNTIRELKIELKKELPLKYDIYRKLTHLVVLGIILFYFTLGFLVQHIFINLLKLFPENVSELFFSVFGIESVTMIFTQYLVEFLVGISLIGLLTADFVRIIKPENYPLKPVNRILREKELHTRFGPQISMAIGCFSIIILYGLFQPIGPLVICTSMTMSILGDIASNLIGRTLGRKKIRNTNKTYEGLFAGIIVAFISGLIVLVILTDFYLINLLALIILPLIGSLIIGILDYIDLEIDDNLSYNFVVSSVLFLISIFII